MSTGEFNVNSLSMRIFFQVILGCMKLTFKADHYKAKAICWLLISMHYKLRASIQNAMNAKNPLV